MKKPYPHDPRYIIYTDGRVYSTITNRFLKPGAMSKFGHQSVVVEGGKSKCLHALVLETFVGPRPDGFDGAHLDGDARNNHLDNLAWKSRRENNLDITRHDRRKFSQAVTAAAKLDLAFGMNGPQVAARWGMSQTHVYNLKKGVYRNEC